MPSTLADKAIEVRDRVRKINVNKQIAHSLFRLEEEASRLKAEAISVRRLCLLAKILSPGGILPKVALPNMSDIGRAEQWVLSVQSGSATSINQVSRLVGEFQNQLESAKRDLKTYCGQQGSAIVNTLRARSRAASLMLRLDLSKELSELADRLAQRIQDEKSRVEDVKAILDTCQRIDKEVDEAFNAGTDELKEFLADVAAGTAKLSRLDQTVLEELKASGMADHLVIRLQ